MFNVFSKRNRIALAALAAPILLASAGFAAFRATSGASQAGYSAVLMANGSVFFGKLEGMNSDYPVLTGVYYLQSKPQAPDAAAAASAPPMVLVKRGREWHGPDRMYLNRSQILMVEPVGSGSRVAQLIGEEESRSPKK